MKVWNRSISPLAFASLALVAVVVVLVRSDQPLVAAAGAGLILVLAVSGVVLYRANVRKTRRLLAGFEALKAGEYDHRLDLNGSDDWRQISAQFNELGGTIARREAELRTERDRFAALFENVPDPVVSVVYEDDEPIVRSVNPAFEEVFGYDADAVLGNSLDDHLVLSDREQEADELNEKIQAGNRLHTQVRRKTATGLREFLLYVVPVNLDEQSVYGYAVYSDITKRKQRQRRLQVLNRVLRHDLRNGVTVIEGNAEILRSQLSDPELKQRATAITKRVDGLVALSEKTRLVEQTLDGEDGAQRPTELVGVVERALDAFEGSYVATDVVADLPDERWVYANDLLEQALANMLENAVEHNDQPETEIRVSSSASADGYVDLHVADNGPGISAEQQAVLTGRQPITQTEHGSGLGLWLVNWVVTQSGGELRFAENEPRGSVVTLRLPCAEPADSADRQRNQNR